MIAHLFRSPCVRKRILQRRLGTAIDDLATYLVQRGHSIRTARQYVNAAEHFDHWLLCSGKSIKAINEQLVQTFVSSHLPRCQCPSPCVTTLHPIRAGLRHLLVVLRSTGRIPVARRQDTSMRGKLVEEFSQYLRDECGVAAQTCRYRLRYAREFLDAQPNRGEKSLSGIDASTATRFLVQQSKRWKPGSMKVAATSLRSFFTFLLLTGRADAQLVKTVPTIPYWRLASLPPVLDRRQVEKILASFDRSSGTGLRGYATTMCLAELGLRTCEVAAFTLDDIDWQNGTLRVSAAKTRRIDLLPMPKRLAGRGL